MATVTRVNGGGQGMTAAQQEKQLAALQEGGRLTEALKVAKTLATLRGEAQGADHWQTVDARFEVDAIRCLLRQGEPAQKDYARSFALERQADALMERGRYREAQPLLEKVLAIRRTLLVEVGLLVGALALAATLSQTAPPR